MMNTMYIEFAYKEAQLLSRLDDRLSHCGRTVINANSICIQ